MRKLLPCLALLAMVGCSPANEANAVACGLAVQSVTGASDTGANVGAATVVLATNPSCLALDQAAVAAIKTKVASAKH